MKPQDALEAPEPSESKVGGQEAPVSEEEVAESRRLWEDRAKNKRWDQVKAPESVFRFREPGETGNPRESEEYRDKVVAELGLYQPEKYPHLIPEDRAAATEVVRRKAGAIWVTGTSQTVVRGVIHDVVTVGNPVKTPPHRLNRSDAAFVEQTITDEIKRGQLKRGYSPWGSPAFSTRPHSRHKRRVVVDYRLPNSKTVRAVYVLKRGDNVKSQAAGSIWYTVADAVSGFNQIVNSERAEEVLAVITGNHLKLTYWPLRDYRAHVLT